MVLEVSERRSRYHAPETPYINSGTPSMTKDSFGRT